ncbi:DNA-binding CsgD family transcriptional regulator/tetratricopeptide (TPR) repeat protein [Actinopolyspora biskrensis]|uniref:DNA-binding CsgD family transcriptional regulator/tetratricopeptide (TPR) repeat protein n=1 Tax=Actinopolyspora biskrensis TaxID=1470178 RepID=A0A852YYG8_9ACTN|nr:AAA family ATPase [Actinopolyspora biskrensis]NYH79208.1 DNA-binding CsgD family transcriptional regulator/tetratricopeptide (TPR) repeat protein [Actinopolyspora biskrensis]
MPSDEPRPPYPADAIHEAPPALVGRTAELHVLTEAMSAPPAVLLLEGEAGVGKTRLVGEALESPVLDGHVKLVGSCRPPREPFPYGPVLDALRALVGITVPARLDPVTGTLRSLLPELSDTLPPAPERLADPAAERHLVFRGFDSLLRSIGSAVLVIEDLHWSDEHTGELLRFLVSSPPPNLAVVLTYRREDLHGHPPLGTAYRHPPNTRSAVLTVRPLEPEQVGALAAELLGAEAPEPESARKLHERTAGIPFVVEETLRNRRNGAERAASSLLDGFPSDRDDVPVLLRDSLLERLDSLPHEAAHLVRAASVLDRPAGAELLGRMAGVATPEHHLTAALRANVLYATPEGTYTFRHSPARRAVYASLTVPERTELHGAALRRLAGNDPPPLLRLALHARACGHVEAWLHYGTAAADRATAAGDTSTAVELLGSLLTTSHLSAERLNRLAVKYALAALDVPDRRDETAAVLEGLLDEPRLSGTARGRVRLAHGKMLLDTGSVQPARVQLELAIEELREAPAQAAAGMAALAAVHFGTTRVEECLDWLSSAEDVLGEVGEDSGVRDALAETVPTRLHGGKPVEEWLRLLDRLPPGATEQHRTARAHANIADAYLWLGEYTLVEKHLGRARGLAPRKEALPHLDNTLRTIEFRLCWSTGMWRDSTNNAVELLRDCRNSRPLVVELSLLLALIAIAQADWAEAERSLHATGLDTPENSLAPVVITAGSARAGMRLAQHDLLGAARAVDQALTIVRHKGVWLWASGLVPVAAEVYTRIGRTAEARQTIDRFRSATTGRSAPVVAPAVAAAHAAVCEGEGDIGSAVEWWKVAHSGYAALPQPYSAALMAEKLVFHGAGEPPDGIGPEELVDSFERLGATGDAARCRHSLRCTGRPLSSRRGRKGYGKELSPREREVAKLVARGRTNREIASALFLSPRTVEQHVAKAIRKLGLTNRADLPPE